MIILYVVGIIGIPISVLFAVVNALMAIWLILSRAFLRNSIALRPVPQCISIITYVLATASFAYSSLDGEAWGPFLLGTFFAVVATAGTLTSVRIGKASPISGSNAE